MVISLKSIKGFLKGNLMNNKDTLFETDDFKLIVTRNSIGWYQD